MSPARRALLLLNVAVILVWIALAVIAYDQLPDRIATHFGPSGVPDQFSRRSLASWFALPVIGIATALLMLGIAHVTHRRPELYNIPGKRELLALPSAQQAPFLEQLALFMTIMATSILVLFAAIQYDTWRVATADQATLGTASRLALGLCLGGTLVGMPIWLVHFQRTVRRVAAEHSAQPDTRRRS